MHPSIVKKNKNAPNITLLNLREKILELEAALKKAKQELHAFENQIRIKLDKEIKQIRELYDLYKKQKREKKEKRLEQKKKGRNYKEPNQLKSNYNPKDNLIFINPEEQKELKRLYKEAVVQVHPDKFSQSGEEDKIQRATAITSQLNGIYKSEILMNLSTSINLSSWKEASLK